mmetsp:Transcript_10250/g.15307  ORF Transcript_10250/g.15307 Transcript_10250/m.15307 type:complete len:231 (+) Transcript_10250:1017-1709(+)
MKMSSSTSFSMTSKVGTEDSNLGLSWCHHFLMSSSCSFIVIIFSAFFLSLSPFFPVSLAPNPNLKKFVEAVSFMSFLYIKGFFTNFWFFSLSLALSSFWILMHSWLSLFRMLSVLESPLNSVLNSFKSIFSSSTDFFLKMLHRVCLSRVQSVAIPSLNKESSKSSPVRYFCWSLSSSAKNSIANWLRLFSLLCSIPRAFSHLPTSACLSFLLASFEVVKRCLFLVCIWVF